MQDHRPKEDTAGVLSPTRQTFSESKAEFNTQRKVEAQPVEKVAVVE
jgi:hypothetical protein